MRLAIAAISDDLKRVGIIDMDNNSVVVADDVDVEYADTIVNAVNTSQQ